MRLAGYSMQLLPGLDKKKFRLIRSFFRRPIQDRFCRITIFVVVAAYLVTPRERFTSKFMLCLTIPFCLKDSCDPGYGGALRNACCSGDCGISWLATQSLSASKGKRQPHLLNAEPDSSQRRIRYCCVILTLRTVAFKKSCDALQVQI